ncbi:MAG: DUF89 domain-containing protein [Candidatus Bathyarchaeia archaeon]
MKPKPLCLVCTFRTAHDIAEKSTDDENLQMKIILETATWLSGMSAKMENVTPAYLHTQVCRIARRITGNPDPFLRIKRSSNEQALRTLPLLEKMIRKTQDAKENFRLAVRIAICGNAVDFEVEDYAFSLDRFDAQLLSCVERDPAIDHTSILMQQLERAEKVLYLLDNAGEIVFDKILIDLIKRTYNCEVWAVVKEQPVLNDALIEDAEQVRLTSVVPVITTGNDHIGVDLDRCSETFLNHLRTSDLIIAKGQGCYETLTELRSSLRVPICYLLRAKCPIVADDLGVPLQSSVVKFVDPHGERW